MRPVAATEGDVSDSTLSVRRQCELLRLHRSNVYYEPVPVSDDDLRLMRLIDEKYLRHRHLGSRGMVSHLGLQGAVVNRKKIQRILRSMGLKSLAPGLQTTRREVKHQVYPYLLRGLEITRPNQVWACDIMFVPMQRGYLYLTVVKSRREPHSRFSCSRGMLTVEATQPRRFYRSPPFASISRLFQQPE